MKELKNNIATANENNTTVNTSAASVYVKPAIEVIEMEMEGAILQESATGDDFNDGGHFGR